MTQGESPPHFETIVDAGATRPWLTMVHGFTQHSGLFVAQVRAFRDRFRLLLVDLPGHGRSSAMPGPYGLAEYAAAVAWALDRTGVDATHYWGTHTGAAVGLLLAVRTPRRFRSLVLDGAVLPGVDVPSVAATIARARATARTRGIPIARREWFDHAAWFDVIRGNPEACRAADHRALIDEFRGAPWMDDRVSEPVAPIHDALAGLDLPVLLVNGEHDLPDFVAMADTLEAVLPDVRRLVVPGGGGFPLWEMPDVVDAHVAAFLARCDAEAVRRP